MWKKSEDEEIFYKCSYIRIRTETRTYNLTIKSFLVRCDFIAAQTAGEARLAYWGHGRLVRAKSMEKNPESEEDLLEHRTDGTDAFDTLYIGAEKFPQHDIYPLMVGGVS